jgi:hypothetical protein
MFSTNLSSYVPPVPTVLGSTLSSAFENAKFTLAGGPNELLTLLGNKATITTDGDLTGGSAPVQNRDCVILMPNTANRTITLPAASGQRFPIVIQKTSNNFNTITVNRSSSDTINSPFGSVAAPSATSFVLHLPGEAYMFIPSGTYWRMVVLNLPVNQCTFRATFTGSGVPITTDPQKVAFNLDSGIVAGRTLYDIGSNYDTVNYRFVAPFNGVYCFSSSIVASNSAVDTFATFNLNGTEVARFGGRHNVNTPIDLVGSIDNLSMTAGQYVEVFVQGIGRGMVEDVTYFAGMLVTKT